MKEKTELKFLSHASATISCGGKTLIMDPWLIGSCYWRSWWNYPPVADDLLANLKVDAIYLTHVHWDHWHGPTLKKMFPKDTLIITHDEPNKRSVNDLKAIGFKNLKTLKHGESFTLGDIRITPYQFGIFLNDSAVVVETPSLNLLNANDCKIAGSSLRQIIKKYGTFDFALRSHSTANDRVCYSVENEVVKFDDTDHYSKAFSLFMNAVKPRFAVPFASNHCHLHKDVISMNDFINDPFKLREFLEHSNALKGSELKIMLSGDSWSSENGFDINGENAKYFINKERHIAEYQKVVQPKLTSYYALENKMLPNERIIEMFEGQINSIPKILRLGFGKFEYKMVLFTKETELAFRVNVKNGVVKKCGFDNESGALVRIPAKIFIDAVMLNMFHHSSISKRIQFKFTNIENMRKYEKFHKLLEYVELEVFPLNIKYLFRLGSSYTRRWRELMVYIKALVLLKRGHAIYEIEEEILKNT